MNDQNGAGSGSTVQFWNYGGIGEPNKDWNIWQTGTVECSPNSFPFFSTDSALLTLCSDNYSGAEVLKFAWAPNQVGSGSCVEPGFNNTSADKPAILSGCVAADYDDTSDEYFIYDDQTDHLVDTELTANSYEENIDHIYWLISCGSTESNGTGVCVGPADPLAWTIDNKP